METLQSNVVKNWNPYYIDSNIYNDQDEFSMFMRVDYYVTDWLKIRMPSVQDVFTFGEHKYHSSISALTCIPSDMISELYSNGIDYRYVSDFELFAMLFSKLTKDDVSIILCDIDPSEFTVYKDPDTGRIEIKNELGDKVIDEVVYMRLARYLRRIHFISPKPRIAANDLTFQALLQVDKTDKRKAARKKLKSQLFPLVSAMMAYPGFKYKRTELDLVGLFEFYDTIQRSQIIENALSVMRGMYSGMIDSSKINKDAYNWMRDIEPPSPNLGMNTQVTN